MFRFLGSCGGLHCCGLRPNTYSGIGIKCVKYFSSNNIVTKQARYNALDIQMLSKSLHEQIFGHHISDADNEQIDNSIEHLTKHNLYGRPISLIPDVDFKLPPLRGSNIEEHFKIIAEEQTRSYFEMAERLSRVSLPPRPKEWSFEPGWTKYDHDGDLMVGMPVECPDGDVMVFDVEVCVNEGQFPTMAVLATPENWYNVSPSTCSSLDK
jgi:DNA polymerase gamma 1